MVKYNVEVYNLPNSIEKDRFSLFIANLMFYYNSGFYYKTGCNCLPEL